MLLAIGAGAPGGAVISALIAGNSEFHTCMVIPATFFGNGTRWTRGYAGLGTRRAWIEVEGFVIGFEFQVGDDCPTEGNP